MPPVVHRVESILAAAVELDCEAVRRRFVDEACAGDAELKNRVEELIENHFRAGSFLESPAPDLLGADNGPVRERAGTVIGPYKLLEQIGEGGFGVVFMAEQTRPVRRKVALKIVKPGMDTRQVVARFEAERQALALMDHPNIAHVFEGGETASGRPYFVMELVRGIPVTDFCDQNQLPVRERLELFMSVCQAVHHAHQRGIIHRDLKPTNVLVTMHDHKAVVKVIDFGIAKATGQQLTEKTLFTNFAQMIGTPLYMSPEQAQLSGLDVDTRSDIYSLGVLLYELLTGTTPVDKERLRTAGHDEIRRIIREEEPAKPSTRMSTLAQVATAASTTASANRRSDPKRLSQLLRGELDWIVMKALEKDRNRRYESASAFAADVQRYMNDEPVQACPPSTWYRFGKFARRNRGALVTATVLALAAVLVVGVVAGSVGWMARDRSVRQARLNQEVEHALDDADKARSQALTLTDNPYRWEAALAEAASDLKRAQGMADQDETALEPALRERLQAIQILLKADEADRRFAARFDEVRLEQAEVNVTVSEFKTEVAFAALKEAFQRHYRIAFAATPDAQAVTIIQQRPKAMQDVLLAALEICLDNAPKDDQQARPWLETVLDAADTGPWRKRAQQALRASDWKAFEQVVDDAVVARLPPSRLLRLAWKSPWTSATCLKLVRRIRQAYPGDFWANHDLANNLHYAHARPEEAIRYYTAALALRPHNPAACVNLGNALRDRGDLDGAISAYREALDGHPDYVLASDRLARALEQKGDPDGAIGAIHQMMHFAKAKDAGGHLLLGNILVRNGRRDEAIANYRKAIALDPKHGMAHYNLATVLLDKKECLDESIACCQSAIACYRATVRLNPKGGGSHNLLAWILVTCPHVPLRDPAEGVELARTAVELSPSDPSFWNTLGAAHYRAGDWKDAAAALEKAMQLRSGGNSYDWFFLAMAHWQLGDPEKARQEFDRAVQWMDKNMPKGRELGRFRAEAAELLKVDSKKN
jgi:serine/threonine protein kinase/Flp pilus assembly protein TadD